MRKFGLKEFDLESVFPPLSTIHHTGSSLMATRPSLLIFSLAPAHCENKSCGRVRENCSHSNCIKLITTRRARLQSARDELGERQTGLCVYKQLFVLASYRRADRVLADCYRSGRGN